MAPLKSAHHLRPTESNASNLVEAVIAGKDRVKEFFSNLDKQVLMPVAAFAATLGLGTALYFLGQNKSSTDESSSSAKTKKRRTRSPRSVVFQEPASPHNKVDAAGEDEDIDDTPAGKVASKEKITDDNSNLASSAAAAEAPEISPPENVLVLKQCPRGRKTPCIAPFPLKLETFLRVHGLKYEVDFNGHEPRHYGSPWIRFNTEDITDSQTVLQFLIKQYDIKTEKNLTAGQRSISTAYAHLLENHLYWGIALWRWVYDGGRSLKDIQLLPKKTQELIPDVCKTVEQAAWFHGIGKMAPEEVKRAVVQDLRSLSEFLGNKEYFLDTPIPTELDCTAFGMLAQFMWNMKGPFHDAVVNQYKNLRDFCWRIRLNYWPDWEDCLNNTQFYSDEPYPTADTVNYPY